MATLTRTTDNLVNADGHDVNGDGRVSLSDDLQARIDAANQAGSDLFVDIHFNGSADASMRGTTTAQDTNYWPKMGAWARSHLGRVRRGRFGKPT